MNSRKRLNIALNLKGSDKVPLDLGGHQSGILIKTYRKLLDYLEINDNNIKLPCEELLERFDVALRNT